MPWQTSVLSSAPELQACALPAGWGFLLQSLGKAQNCIEAQVMQDSVPYFLGLDETHASMLCSNGFRTHNRCDCSPARALPGCDWHLSRDRRRDEAAAEGVHTWAHGEKICMIMSL